MDRLEVVCFETGERAVRVWQNVKEHRVFGSVRGDVLGVEWGSGEGGGGSDS